MSMSSQFTEKKYSGDSVSVGSTKSTKEIRPQMKKMGRAIVLEKSCNNAAVYAQKVFTEKMCEKVSS